MVRRKNQTAPVIGIKFGVDADAVELLAEAIVAIMETERNETTVVVGLETLQHALKIENVTVANNNITLGT